MAAGTAAAGREGAMRDTDENWFYLPAGVVGAIALGMALVPLREYTYSGNFTFLFVILIVAVAELGGRWAALATAGCSALSLDFFLTRPYLRLSIEGKHDIIAFAGLAVCGLVAAAIGARRGERIAALDSARADLDLLHAALAETTGPGPVETRLAAVLRDARETLPLAGAVLRDAAGQAVSASNPSLAERPLPGTILDRDTLLPPGMSIGDLPHRGLALPGEGGRLALETGGHQVGWFDLWGSGAPATLQTRRTLSTLARLLGSMMGR